MGKILILILVGSILVLSSCSGIIKRSLDGQCLFGSCKPEEPDGQLIYHTARLKPDTQVVLYISEVYGGKTLVVPRQSLRFEFSSAVGKYPIVAGSDDAFTVYYRNFEQKMKFFPFALLD